VRQGEKPNPTESRSQTDPELSVASLTISPNDSKSSRKARSMRPYDYLKERQYSWARRHGIAIDEAGYVEELNDNHSIARL